MFTTRAPALAVASLCVFLVSPSLAANKQKIPQATTDRVVKAVTDFYGPGVAASQVFLGSEICLACHKDAGGWRRSLHATGLKVVPTDSNSMKLKDGIIFDANKNGVDDFKDGLDFNAIASAFDRFKPNAPVLKYDAAKGYLLRIGQVDFPVVFAHGGSGLYKQRVVVRIPVADRPDKLSAGVYESPVQFNETSKTYVVYNAQYWYTSDNRPIFTPSSTAKDAAKSNSFHKLCAGCHASNVVAYKDANDEYLTAVPPAILTADDDVHYLDLNFDGQPEQYNTGCERCHGPGGRHVLGRGDPDAILNPKNMTAKQQNELCGGCHSRGASLPDNLHEYPYDEKTNTDYGGALGEPLFSRFFADKAGLWPDRQTSRQHHQQLNDLMKSAKWEFEFHKSTCSDCHETHNDNRAHLRDTIRVEASPGNALNINVKGNTNALCLACHAGFGPFDKLKRADIADLKTNASTINTVVNAHSRHRFDAENPTRSIGCTTCHMANMAASGDAYDISSHLFRMVPPDATLQAQSAGGQPNSCATCHRSFAQLFGLPADQSLTNWTEPSDVQLATFLKTFFGPEGTWFKTK
ncbi:MAG: hypothetical protein JNL98_33660 [Bryobacterales bacterium]|nr:hypothetical protein [Bryobacterales bacterium]